MSKSDFARLEFLLTMIERIETIIHRHGSLTEALGDEAEGQMALLMCLEQIGETLHKLKSESVIAHFDPKDIKGAYDVRLFIAHDYEGVNLALIEKIIRIKIPLFKKICQKVLDEVK